LKTLFPGSTILSNTSISSENIILEEEDKLKVYEFDVSFISFIVTDDRKIFLPHLSLTLEYQGDQHYLSNKRLGNSAVYQRRDQAKRTFASQFGLTLISIPFWWDRSLSSLAATIQYYRPDITIQEKNVPPIPFEMPVKHKKLKQS
jgi:hypothetical protein